MPVWVVCVCFMCERFVSWSWEIYRKQISFVVMEKSGLVEQFYGGVWKKEQTPMNLCIYY